MKSLYNLTSLRTGLLLASACLLTACVTPSRPPEITIVEGVTLNQIVELPVCENLEIQINDKQQVDIIGLDTVETTCIYKDKDKKRQIKGLPMALIAFPADQKPSFIADNFMLVLLSKNNLLLRIQMDTQGIATQQEALSHLKLWLGEPSANQPATENNAWGASPQATLAAWNTDFVEAMFIGEIASTHLGSFSITSKNIYQYTTDAAITYTTPDDEASGDQPQAQVEVKIEQETPTDLQTTEEKTPSQQENAVQHPPSAETKPVEQETLPPKNTGKIREESVPSTQATQETTP